jgi:hypothetical protein
VIGGMAEMGITSMDNRAKELKKIGDLFNFRSSN